MLLGVDIGTTNVKVFAVTTAGTTCAAAERQNETIVPHPGWSEQDPESIFQHVCSALAEVLQQKNVAHGEAIQGIVFSSAMHGLVAVDMAGKPMTNVWLWSDLRAKRVARTLRSEGTPGMNLYQQTGVPIHPMSPLCKLCWMREQQPEVFLSAHKFLDIKAFIWFRLTGKYEMDISCASATGLMNIFSNQWDEKALDLAGITTAQLPTLVSTYHIGKLQEGLQLPKVLIIGASDGALANLGAGATLPQQLTVTIGTSAAIRCVTNFPVLDYAMRSFCYRLDENRCIVGGASNNGANVLEWLRNSVFQSSNSAEKFVNQALEVAPGAEGLVFLPYLQGERAPLWNPSARATFQGLTAAHGQAHFIRAALEGILFNLKMIAKSLPNTFKSIYASGGFSQNDLWVQMLADIFQTPVLLQESGMDASVAGAIQMGRSALGLKPLDTSQHQRLIAPNPATASAYQDAYLHFQKTAIFGTAAP